MSISRKDIEYIANLARLEFSQEEAEAFTNKFESILKYVEKLKELDVDDIQPTHYVHFVENTLREDNQKPSYDRRSLLMNAPDKADGYFKVPKVL